MKKRVFSLLLAVIIVLPLFSTPVTAAGKIDIAVCAISGVKSITPYTSGKIMFNVAVKHGSKLLKQDRDFTATYSNNINIGTGCVFVKGVGDYTGTVIKAFTIIPQKTKITSVKQEKGKAVLTWDKVGNVDGYRVYYSENADYYGGNADFNLLKSIKSGNTTSLVTSELKRGATYYFYVVCYKTVGGTKFYSDKSAIKSVQITTTPHSGKINPELIGRWKTHSITESGKIYTMREYAESSAKLEAESKNEKYDKEYADYLYETLLSEEFNFKTDETVEYSYSYDGYNQTDTYYYYQTDNKIVLYDNGYYTGDYNDVLVFFANENFTELKVYFEREGDDNNCFILKKVS